MAGACLEVARNTDGAGVPFTRVQSNGGRSVRQTYGDAQWFRRLEGYMGIRGGGEVRGVGGALHARSGTLSFASEPREP